MCVYFPFTIRWSLKGTRAGRHVARARFLLFSWKRNSETGLWILLHCFRDLPSASFRFGLRGSWGICFTMISVNIWGPNCSHKSPQCPITENKLGLEPRAICRLIFVQIHYVDVWPVTRFWFHFRSHVHRRAHHVNLLLIVAYWFLFWFLLLWYWWFRVGESGMRKGYSGKVLFSMLNSQVDSSESQRNTITFFLSFWHWNWLSTIANFKVNWDHAGASNYQQLA